MKDNNKSQSERSPRKSVSADTGDWGEKVAQDYLVSLGFALRELNWRGPHFEVDIIAQRGTRMAFVEVKTRTSPTADPAQAVNRRKRQRMINAAHAYLQSLAQPFDYQFDIISISGRKDNYTLEYIPDAFFPTPKGGGSF